MRSLGLITRVNVLTAIRDHDLQGATEFRETLGFEEPSEEVLVERGKRYDARAVLAYAHGKATGDYLGPDRVTLASLDTLSELDFRITTTAELDRPRTVAERKPRTPRTPSARSTTTSRSKPEKPVALCPSCFTQLSVTGTCDFCD